MKTDKETDAHWHQRYLPAFFGQELKFRLAFNVIVTSARGLAALHDYVNQTVIKMHKAWYVH